MVQVDASGIGFCAGGVKTGGTSETGPGTSTEIGGDVYSGGEESIEGARPSIGGVGESGGGTITVRSAGAVPVELNCIVGGSVST